jgi:hypothetical protein
MISITKKNGSINITVVPDKEPQISSTGKSLVVASTKGFVPVEGTDYRINLTMIAPLPKPKSTN